MASKRLRNGCVTTYRELDTLWSVTSTIAFKSSIHRMSSMPWSDCSKGWRFCGYVMPWWNRRFDWRILLRLVSAPYPATAWPDDSSKGIRRQPLSAADGQLYYFRFQQEKTSETLKGHPKLACDHRTEIEKHLAILPVRLYSKGGEGAPAAVKKEAAASSSQASVSFGLSVWAWVYHLAKT